MAVKKKELVGDATRIERAKAHLGVLKTPTASGCWSIWMPRAMLL